jgi:[histone H3]-lysine36 N-dimethyltransferase SETMAR
MFLHDDNARPHTAARTMNFLAESEIQLLPHPPYSPGLAPCDFFLFPYLKRQLRGKRFPDENAAVEAMKGVLEEVPKIEFQNCFQSWFERMEDCKQCQGRYFEKE